MAVRTVHAVLDTNTPLHFKRADQIDWLALLNCNKAVIHITPVLVRELETQKVHNKSPKLRERANATIRWLAQLSRGFEQVEIRPAVELLFIRRSPTIDYGALHLRRDISDDEFIAHAIEYRNNHDVELVIVTNDYGLGLKAPAHDIPTVSPNPEDKLADDLDESQKEIARLKKTLAQLQARTPQLVLTFRDGKIQSEETIKRIFTREPPSSPYDYLPPGKYTEQQMENAKRRANYEKVIHAYHNLTNAYIPVRLTLQNSGKAQATDIHIDLKVPEIVTPYAEYPQYPNREPQTSEDSVTPSKHSSRRARQLQGPQPSVDSDFNEVSYRLNSLVQHRLAYLGTFYLKFLDLKKIENFSISARTTCVELADIIHNDLHFTVKFEGFSMGRPWWYHGDKWWV
jgi:hypothetical protein